MNFTTTFHGFPVLRGHEHENEKQFLNDETIEFTQINFTTTKETKDVKETTTTKTTTGLG